METSNKDLITACIETGSDSTLMELKDKLISYDDIRNDNDIELIKDYLIAKGWFLAQIKLKKETLASECTNDYEFNYDQFVCYATIEVLSIEETPGTYDTAPDFKENINTYYQIKYIENES